jgi:hypothetical protein
MDTTLYLAASSNPAVDEGQIKSLQALLRQGWKKSLSPGIRERLDPEFVTFYETLKDSPDQELEGGISLLRQKPSWFAGGDRDSVEVGDIRVDIVDTIEGRKVKITVILPKESLQGEKRPCMVWFHGGEASIWLQADSTDRTQEALSSETLRAN